MTSATKASVALTSRYANALIDLAEKAGSAVKVEQDLRQLESMIKESADLLFFVRSPSINQKSQKAAILAIADKAGFETLTRNFLGALVQNRRLNALESIIRAVKDEISRRSGEISVQVETAQDLTPAQLKDLQAALSRSIHQKISIKAKVEPALLGGMIVTIGSKMIDDSVRHKLERLKAAMGRQANENIAKAESA